MSATRRGLLIDAYFSGTKIKWILDNVPGARERAEKGELLFGNVDSWLIWNLTGGREHISDFSNCSRTMLFDIDRLRWDSELCRALDVPVLMLPAPVPSSAEYGRVAPGIKGLEALAGVPICGSAGDQAAALLGQGCVQPGEGKNTYGTGCFTLVNTGRRSVRSVSGMLTSVAWSVNGQTTYAMEGSVFNAGSAIQWLRDELGLISSAAESGEVAASVPDNAGVYMVPAFTGLGAPYWDMYARGTIVGLTRGATRAHIVRAAMEGIAYEVADLLRAMERDSGVHLPALRVDGGASVSDFLMQFQADILRLPIDRPAMVETTAFGAAFLAGLAAGVWSGMDEIAELRRSERVFTPQMDAGTAAGYFKQWQRALKRSLRWGERRMSESILVVRREYLAPYLTEDFGLITEGVEEIVRVIEAHHEFRPRPEMETDPAYKQIIPYVLVTRGAEAFVMQRLKKGGEQRLHGLLSLGVGRAHKSR